ncbi:helix-turn-helix domain-containing protein [Streptococcus bovimastitidis]|uniref:helix-turn-helix domain-containing protein n=1 Tax=Streptococcus bovimastitidis TaxID=1856638 RepID=UPI000B1A2211|nr:helix-turn-helix transcriptional regulator [Streptococcus bovimastitidis]
MERLGQNLKQIREKNGETITDLSEILGKAINTISQYENNKRKPNYEDLEKISNHYNVSIDDLLYSDLSDSLETVKMLNNIKNNYEFLNKKCLIMFPILSSTEAKQNQKFTRAIKLHKSWFNNFEHFTDHEMDELFDLYFDLYFETDLAVVRANILGIIFLVASMGNMSEIRDEFLSFIKHQGKTNKYNNTKFFVSNFYLDRKKTSLDEIIDTSKSEIDNFILLLLSNLKGSETLYNLREYYLALRYIFGIINNSFNEINNNNFGILLMLDLEKMGNKYAKNYLSLIRFVYNN